MFENFENFFLEKIQTGKDLKQTLLDADLTLKTIIILECFYWISFKFQRFYFLGILWASSASTISSKYCDKERRRFTFEKNATTEFTREVSIDSE